jgi:hypothetical protein
VGIRTSNLLIRSQMLYPVELRAPNSNSRSFTYEEAVLMQQKFTQSAACHFST